MKTKDYIPVKLETLSPVHIGSGQELDPFSYVIKENGGSEPILYFIDIALWIESRPNVADVTAYFASHNYAEVRKFLYERIEDPSRYALAAIPVKDTEIFETYKRVVLGAKPENRLLLDGAVKNPLSFGLIVPGSSVKGAIHTAILDYIDLNYGVNLKGKYLKAMKEAKDQGRRNINFSTHKLVFGKPKESAFKALKITDFEAPPGDAYIVSAKEKSEKKGKQPTPKDNCEATRSLLMDGRPFEMFGKMAVGFQRKKRGTLTVEKNLEVPKYGEEFDFKKICEVVNAFYRERFLKEWKRFYVLPHFEETAKALAPLKKMVEDDAAWQNAMLLRLGHYSHIECVTITNNAPFRRRGKKGLYPYGTTRTLANGLYPFGWVRISRITEAEYREGIARLEEKKRAVLKQKTRLQQVIREEREAAEAERKLKEEERHRAEEEARKKREEFENFPEYKKRVMKIKDLKTDNNTVMEYFRQLDQFEGEERREIAAALKERWQGEGRWKVARKKKQYEKVQKIKEILGED